ncbi:MAG: hypothetical protein ACWGPR_09995 [Candidatus Deferrimicrobiaceae bacterium]
MMENMSEEERIKMMERCFEFMKGEETGQGKEQDEKKREESGSLPNMGKMAECCPEMMGTFFTKMKGCFEGKGEKEKKEGGERKEKPGCC